MAVVHDGLFIDGSWVSPATDRRIQVVNATTEESLGSVPEAANADVDRAVQAARRVFDDSGWATTAPAERAAVLDRFADALEKRSEQLTRTVSLQNGMPVSLSEQFEGGYVVALLRYYAGLAASAEFEERRPSPLGFDTLVQRAPIGVVAGIVPWNYPVLLAVTKIGPALAAGCTLVLKPSPGTVLDSFILAEAAEEAGVPPGVINWVPGGRELGDYLVKHPGIDKVAFTGSTAAGRTIAENCGRLMRPVNLELGGKSAAVILDDADLKKVTDGLFFASLANNGQTCMACTRILAPRSRYDEVVDALTTSLSGLKIGDPLDPTTELGPLASAEHRDRVEGYIAQGRAEGSKVALGGGRPAGIDRGWFVEPTIFADVDNSATVAREEIFGPVLSVIKYDGDDEAVKIANDSEYGLGGSVWSTDSERAMNLARQVQTGTIGVNGYVIDLNAPFGGVKASGIGREFGPEALAGYQQLKSIYLPG
ncbi:aldehyde dehydrogenase [Saccharopolyspora sp. HNM0986]|uniref:aldehyde dehydrogenase n=1 Tax=Saccharopolyspora galaxeae TaxID=2781241 RepID=UPI00190A5742|nr:aldehyde dehydrogenase [Saccharopolyspora sp. HNM0986]MBK0870406.1 aldehyde dehydrogenase [Saccharopolyspora sp. HNM0986]